MTGEKQKGEKPKGGIWRGRLGRSGKLALITLLAATVGIALVANGAKREIAQRKQVLESQARLFTARNGQIEYADWGEGVPILVIHGAGGGHDQGRLLAEALGPENRRWIAISRFGYLHSDLPKDASPSAQADAINDLLVELRIDQVDILAMSGGVPPALKFAELYPDKAGRMALLAPAPFTPFGAEVGERPMPTWLYSAMLGNHLAYWALTKMARGQLAQAFDARPELRDNLPPAEHAFIANLIDGFVPASARVAGTNNEGAAIAPNQQYNLASISSPTIVIHAADDRINSPEIAHALSAQIPEARRITYDKGGHLLLGHHREMREALRQFLGS